MSFDRGTGATGTGEASVLAIDKGGTGADTAAEARTNLNLGALFSDSNGNVAIGSTTPFDKLDVNGGLTVRGNLGVYSQTVTQAWSGNTYGAYNVNNGTVASAFALNANQAEIRIITNHPLLLLTNNLERMRVSATGDVGIGTSSPARKLHVSDVMRLEPRNGSPSSPSKGDIYFDSADDKLKCYDGTIWQNLF